MPVYISVVTFTLSVTQVSTQVLNYRRRTPLIGGAISRSSGQNSVIVTGGHDVDNQRKHTGKRTSNN